MNIFSNVIIAATALLFVIIIDSAFYNDIAKSFSNEIASGIRLFGFGSIVIGSPIATIFNINYELVVFEFAGFVVIHFLMSAFFIITYSGFQK